MIKGKRIIALIVGVLVVTAADYADMVPASQPGAGHWPSAAVCSSPVRLCADSLGAFNSPGIADLGAWPVLFLPEKDLEAAQAAQPQPSQVLTDGTSSLRLCLSALMGMGLCGSVHWVKRLHLGFIPQWYHDGGPHQVGHSYALMPNSLCPVPAHCFIQPVCTVGNVIAQYRLGIVLSLWRKSQCTPRVLGSRAPPVTA